MWEQNWKTRFCLASKGQFLLPEGWVHSAMVNLFVEHPPPERGRGGPLVNKGRSLRKCLFWRWISLAFYKVQVKSSSFLLHFSCSLLKAWWPIADPKPTTKFVYSFIKAKVQFSTHFFSIIGLTGTSCAATSSGIQLPYLTVKGQTNK